MFLRIDVHPPAIGVYRPALVRLRRRGSVREVPIRGVVRRGRSFTISFQRWLGVAISVPWVIIGAMKAGLTGMSRKRRGSFLYIKQLTL